MFHVHVHQVYLLSCGSLCGPRVHAWLLCLGHNDVGYGCESHQAGGSAGTVRRHHGHLGGRRRRRPLDDLRPLAVDLADAANQPGLDHLALKKVCIRTYEYIFNP